MFSDALKADYKAAITRLLILTLPAILRSAKLHRHKGTGTVRGEIVRIM